MHSHNTVRTAEHTLYDQLVILGRRLDWTEEGLSSEVRRIKNSNMSGVHKSVQCRAGPVLCTQIGLRKIVWVLQIIRFN